MQRRLGKPAASLYGGPILRASLRTADFAEARKRLVDGLDWARLEWRGQDGQNETEQRDHCPSLGDSITSLTRIRFSVHTPVLTRARRRQVSADRASC